MNRLALLLMLLLVPGGGVFAQIMQTTEGRDFWVGFLHNGQQDRLMGGSGYTLAQATSANSWQLVANAETAGQVTATCGTWSTTVSVPAGGSVTINVPYESGATPVMRYTRPCYSRRIYPVGIHVTSTVDISLYALNYISASFDATTVLPTNSLGTHYILQDFNYSSITSGYLADDYDGGEMCIVATEDNTTIQIKFNTATVIDSFAFSTPAYTADIHTNQPAGSSFRTITLQAGGYIQLITPKGNSFTGTEVTSDLPIAVFSGRKRCTVPHARRASNNTSTYGAPDHLYEQAIPTNMWGKTFLVVLDHRTEGNWDYINIVSKEADCHLTIVGTGHSNRTIDNAGGNTITNMPTDHTPLYISADKPISVCLYLSSYSFRGNEGDPSSVIIPPLEQATSRTVFNAYSTANSTTHRTNVVVPNSAVAGMRLDGSDISSQFTAFGTSGYSYAKVPVSAGTHTLSNTLGNFNAWFYGMGTMESYAYTAAMSLDIQTYHLLVDSDPTYHWGDTLFTCHGNSHRFKIETTSDIETRWFVDGTLQTSTDTTLQCTFTSGLHTVTALQRGSCTAPDFCDTLHFFVRATPSSAGSLTDTVYADQFPYTLNDSTYNSPGSYTQHFTASNGCDSILTLTLIARPHSYDDHILTNPATPVVIYPTLNDTIPCSNFQFTFVTLPVHGNVASCYGAGNNEGNRDDLDELLGDGSNIDQTPIPCITYTPETTLGELDEPPVPYIGLDSLQVATCCNGICDTSWVYINVTPLPDNIQAVQCALDVESSPWDAHILNYTDNNMHTYFCPVAGDIDGDGNVEIVSALHSENGLSSKKLRIFRGSDLSIVSTINITQGMSSVDRGSYALVRYPDGSGGMQGALIVHCSDHKLRSYSIEGSLLATTTGTTPCWGGGGAVSVADINNDGWPEVVFGNAVYDAATLQLLCAGPATGNKGIDQNVAIPHTANVLGNENLELICGNTIYSVNITSRTNPTLNSVSTLKTITPPAGFQPDGHTIAADFNLDGNLDILVAINPGHFLCL